MFEAILFDNDGVLVDTEYWYFRAGERALASIGVEVALDNYLEDMSQGRGTWARARTAGVDEKTIDRLREARDGFYQDYLRTESIEIDGVVEALAELSAYVQMAIVTTAKRADFEIIHEKREIVPFMEFVLVREDYEHAKPHPEPYLTAARLLDVLAGECLAIEDSDTGATSAAAAGCTVLCAPLHVPVPPGPGRVLVGSLRGLGASSLLPG